MSYIGALAAVRSRLLGKEFSFVPPYPEMEDLAVWLQEHNATLDNAIGTASVASDDKSNRITLTNKLQVPVFYFGPEGSRERLIYPSLSYEIIDFTPRFTEYLYNSPTYRGEDYKIPFPGSEEIVYDGDVNLGSHARMITRRPIEQPFDFMVELRSYSTDPVESAMLVSYVYSQFEPRGYLRVPMKDGTYRSWDMLFSSFQDLDTREAVRAASPGIVREYSKVWTYKIEGYLDNTDLAALENLVRKRTLSTNHVGD